MGVEERGLCIGFEAGFKSCLQTPLDPDTEHGMWRCICTRVRKKGLENLIFTHNKISCISVNEM